MRLLLLDGQPCGDVDPTGHVVEVGGAVRDAAPGKNPRHGGARLGGGQLVISGFAADRAVVDRLVVRGRHALDKLDHVAHLGVAPLLDVSHELLHVLRAGPGVGDQVVFVQRQPRDEAVDALGVPVRASRELHGLCRERALALKRDQAVRGEAHGRGHRLAVHLHGVQIGLYHPAVPGRLDDHREVVPARAAVHSLRRQAGGDRPRCLRPCVEAVEDEPVCMVEHFVYELERGVGPAVAEGYPRVVRRGQFCHLRAPGERQRHGHHPGDALLRGAFSGHGFHAYAGEHSFDHIVTSFFAFSIYGSSGTVCSSARTIPVMWATRSVTAPFLR